MLSYKLGRIRFFIVERGGRVGSSALTCFLSNNVRKGTLLTYEK